MRCIVDQEDAVPAVAGRDLGRHHPGRARDDLEVGRGSERTLDESSPIETEGDRDGYTETKLLQENLVRDYAAAGGEVVIVRPGLVWGANELWDGGHAQSLGRYALAIGPRSSLKLTYIENCADALVLAAESPEAAGATINIVDDDQPNQSEFAAGLRAASVGQDPRVDAGDLTHVMRTFVLAGREIDVKAGLLQLAANVVVQREVEVREEPGVALS